MKTGDRGRMCTTGPPFDFSGGTHLKIERYAWLAGHCLFIVHCGLFSQRRKAWIYAAAAHLDPQIWAQLRHPEPDGCADDFK